jgi:AraC-like DNA-binding protein
MTDSVRAWQPGVPLVREVLHATFDHHAYPAHTHDAWTVLLIDEGTVAYELDRAPHHAPPASISLLPPHVPHDGRSAVDGTPFRKRVLYLEESWLPPGTADAAAATPLIRDERAFAALTAAHAALRSPGDALAAECSILSLGTVVQQRLRTPGSPVIRRSPAADAPLANRLRGLLDDRFTETVTMAEAGRMLGAHPSHLVRVFSQNYGIPPHRYVTGRRVDLARRLLVQGLPVAEAAVLAGFHDQAHLARHFRRVLGTTPGTFAERRAA